MQPTRRCALSPSGKLSSVRTRYQKSGDVKQKPGGLFWCVECPRRSRIKNACSDFDRPEPMRFSFLPNARRARPARPELPRNGMISKTSKIQTKLQPSVMMMNGLTPLGRVVRRQSTIQTSLRSHCHCHVFARSQRHLFLRRGFPFHQGRRPQLFVNRY